MQFKILAIMAVLTLFLCETALAGGESAESLFKTGGEQFENGEYVKAAESFRAAYAQKPSWKLQYNIGQAEAAAGRYGLALDAFEAYLAAGKDDVPMTRSKEVGQEIERLRLLVGIIEVEGPDGTELLVDQKSRGVTPSAGLVRVAVGYRQIELKYNGKTVFEKSVKIVGAATTTVKARVSSDTVEGPAHVSTSAAGEPVDPPAQTATGPTESSSAPGTVSRGKLIGGIVTGILSGGGIALGIVATAMRISDIDARDAAAERFEESGRTDTDARDTAVEKDNRMKTDAALMGVGFGVGGALAITATVLFVLHGKQKKQNSVFVQPNGVAGLSMTF